MMKKFLKPMLLVVSLCSALPLTVAAEEDIRPSIAPPERGLTVTFGQPILVEEGTTYYASADLGGSGGHGTIGNSYTQGELFVGGYAFLDENLHPVEHYAELRDTILAFETPPSFRYGASSVDDLWIEINVAEYGVGTIGWVPAVKTSLYGDLSAPVLEESPVPTLPTIESPQKPAPVPMPEVVQSSPNPPDVDLPAENVSGNPLSPIAKLSAVLQILFPIFLILILIGLIVSALISIIQKVIDYLQNRGQDQDQSDESTPVIPQPERMILPRPSAAITDSQPPSSSQQPSGSYTVAYSSSSSKPSKQDTTLSQLNAGQTSSSGHRKVAVLLEASSAVERYKPQIAEFAEKQGIVDFMYVFATAVEPLSSGSEYYLKQDRVGTETALYSALNSLPGTHLDEVIIVTSGRNTCGDAELISRDNVDAVYVVIAGREQSFGPFIEEVARQWGSQPSVSHL